MLRGLLAAWLTALTSKWQLQLAAVSSNSGNSLMGQVTILHILPLNVFTTIGKVTMKSSKEIRGLQGEESYCFLIP